MTRREMLDAQWSTGRSLEESAGDPERLAPLRSLVLAWARAWCHGAEDEADDLTQETMVRVFSRLHQFRGEAKLTSWTYAVARSVFASQARKVARRARHEGLWASSTMTWTTGSAEEPADGLSPGDIVAWLRILVAEGVLSEAERTTLDLVVLRGMSATQAGPILGIAPGSVRARVCRATRRIRAQGMAVALILSVGLWIGPACSSGGGTSLVTTRDSAGIAIVESTRPSWTPQTAWTIDSVPALDLGRTGTGPMHEFFRVEDASFGADGGIIVADRGSAQVRFYDAQGRFTNSVGADGDGPGEFRRLNQVTRYAGDSIIAFDPSVHRGTVMSTWGSVGRVVTFDLPDRTITEAIDYLYVLASGGILMSVTVLPSDWPRPSPGRTRIGQLVLETSPAGGLQDTVARLRGFEEYIGSTGIMQPPFPKVSRAAAYGDDLYVCEGDAPEYAVRTADGTLRRIVRVPGLSLDVPGHVFDSIRDALERKDEFLQGMAKVLVPTEPFCSGLLVDELGYVWVERFHHPFRMSPEPRTWRVFSPDGAWLGQLDLPANFEAFEVDESRVLGMAKDSMEVQTVQVLGLKRRERRMGVGPRPSRAGDSRRYA